jgi:hypothetical protein
MVGRRENGIQVALTLKTFLESISCHPTVQNIMEDTKRLPKAIEWKVLPQRARLAGSEASWWMMLVGAGKNYVYFDISK